MRERRRVGSGVSSVRNGDCIMCMGRGFPLGLRGEIKDSVRVFCLYKIIFYGSGSTMRTKPQYSDSAASCTTEGPSSLSS